MSASSRVTAAEPQRLAARAPRPRVARVLCALTMTVAAALAAALAPAGLRAAVSEAPAPAATPPEVTAEIEVSGERAGPRMWRISQGEHVVWLLGTLDPLPKRMSWRSLEVERVLSEAQAVLASNPSVRPSVGPISAVRLYLQWRRTEKLPERAHLAAVVPAPLYARFEALKARYDPRDQRIEELRPIIAALRLYERALASSGLTSSNEIEDTVLKLARRHDVRVVRTALKLEDPRGLLDEAQEIPRAAEIDCLAATVGRLESDLPNMQARARDWALGNVEGLRQLPFPPQREVCLNAVTSSPRLRELIARATRDWDAALETALHDNHTTLALRSMYDLLGEQGLIARLRARGYTVEGP